MGKDRGVGNRRSSLYVCRLRKLICRKGKMAEDRTLKNGHFLIQRKKLVKERKPRNCIICLAKKILVHKATRRGQNLWLGDSDGVFFQLVTVG